MASRLRPSSVADQLSLRRDEPDGSGNGAAGLQSSVADQLSLRRDERAVDFVQH